MTKVRGQLRLGLPLHARAQLNSLPHFKAPVVSDKCFGPWSCSAAKAYHLQPHQAQQHMNQKQPQTPSPPHSTILYAIAEGLQQTQLMSDNCLD